MRMQSGYFDVCGYRVTTERMHERSATSRPSSKCKIGNDCVRRSASGVGPVHALDEALRRCLANEFPELEDVRLVRLPGVGRRRTQGHRCPGPRHGQATDGETSWDAGCVSENIVDASFEALCSTAVMGIIRARSAKKRRSA